MSQINRTNPAQRWRGVFAVDGDDKDTRAGQLTYDPCEGIFVETLNFFTPDSASDKSAGQPYPALKGLIEGNRQCTVLNGFATNFKTQGLEEARIIGNELLLDEYCDSPASPLYRRLRFRSPAFTGFVHPRGIKTEVVRRSKTVRIKGNPRPETSCQWGDHTLSLSSTLTPPRDHEWNGKYTLSEQPYLDILFSKPVSLNDIRVHISELEFLSCLADGEFSGPPEITIWRNLPPSRRSKKPLSIKAMTGAELLISQSWYRPANNKHPLRRAILLDTLGPAPLEFIAKWLDLAPHVERLMTLYQAAAQVPNVETRFLFLIQSIEGLHRALDHREGINQKAFDEGKKAMADAIPTSLPKDDRAFLLDRVPRHNEPGLGSRLGDYGRRVKEILPGALPKFSKDRQDIKNLRDEFSHAFPRTEGLDVETHGRKVLYYCELLRLLFEFNLIYHVSLDAEVIAGVYSQNNAFDELERHRSDLVGGK